MIRRGYLPDESFFDLKELLNELPCYEVVIKKNLKKPLISVSCGF